MVTTGITERNGRDIFHAAKLLIEQHGENAPFSDRLVALPPGRLFAVSNRQSVFDRVRYAR